MNGFLQTTAVEVLLACVFLVSDQGRIHAGIFGGSTKYSLEVSYARLPIDDGGVERWLKGRTGIHNVNISRHSNSLNITFEASKHLKAAILFELVGECDHLGYQGRSWFKGSLFDPAQRGTRFQTFWVEYSKLREDDRTMADWLKSHQGVSKTQVWREGRVVVFEFENGDPRESAILGEILKQCEQSGYQGRAGFVDAFGRHR